MMTRAIACARTSRVSIAFLALLALAPAAAVEAVPPRAPTTLVVQGVPVEANEESVKCDIKKIPGVSLRRLADCDSARVITFPNANDISVIRFEIAPDAPEINQGRRAELRDMFDAANGQEVWYRFSTLVPRDFPSASPYRVVLAQWHEQMPLGAPHRRPPLAHRLIDGVFTVTLWNDPVYEASQGRGDGIVLFQDPDYALGAFYDYVYRIVWSPEQNGSVIGWRREKTCAFLDAGCKSGPWARFIRYEGPIGYRVAEGYYFKFGVYTVHPLSAKMTVYHRAYLRGLTGAAVGATKTFFRPPF